MQDLYRERWGRNDNIVKGVTQRQAKLDLYNSISLDFYPEIYEKIPEDIVIDDLLEELNSIISAIRLEDERAAEVLALCAKGFETKRIAETLNTSERTCYKLKVKGIELAKQIHALKMMETESV